MHFSEAIISNLPWQKNTAQNPFWSGAETYHGGPSVAVEVVFKDGSSRRLDCPKCAKRMFDDVVKWRRLY